MQDSQLPDTHADVTPGFLYAVLEPHPDWDERPITSLTMTAMDSPRGTAYRTEIGFEGGGRRTLLVKMHSPEIPREERRNYEGEVYFYNHVAAKSQVPVPRTYIAEWDESTGRQLIVQEFLSEGRIGTASTMLNQVDQEQILSVLAEMHAYWWNSRSLHGLSGIRTSAEAMQSGISRFRSSALDGRKFLECFGEHVHPRIAEHYRSTGGAETGERLRDGFSQHSTLCHYDVSAKNVFLPDDPAQKPVLFDWGLVIKGNVGHELAQFLSASTVPTEHHRLPELVRFYHNELTSRGVNDYDFEKLWTDFRYGCLVRLAAPIALAARGNPRADALALTLLPLVTSAVLSTDAFELLDG